MKRLPTYYSRVRNGLAASTVIIASMCGMARCNGQTADTAKVAAILSEHFESIVYTDSRFLINFRGDLQHDESLNALRLPFIEMMGALAAAGPDAERDLENS